jgi:hypothetical protein
VGGLAGSDRFRVARRERAIPESLEQFLAVEEKKIRSDTEASAGFQRNLPQQPVPQDQKILALLPEGKIAADKIEAAVEF